MMSTLLSAHNQHDDTHLNAIITPAGEGWMLAAYGTVIRHLFPWRLRMPLSVRTASAHRSSKPSRHPAHRSARQHATQAAFPTWAERNQRLKQSLSELVSDSEALAQLKKRAALLRCGAGSHRD